MFYVVSNDGTSIPYAFDQATMTASRIQPSANENGGFTLSFYVEPQFSLVNPNVIYGVGGSNGRTIAQYDFSSRSYSTIADLDAIASGMGGYVGGIMTGGTPNEKLITFFGGSVQDSHYLLLWIPVGNVGGRKILDTHASTINGRPTNVVLNFNLHSTSIDRSGRYVFLNATSADLGAPRYAPGGFVWDTETDLLVALTSGGRDGGPDMHVNGHDAAGFGYWVNMGCCTSSKWDAAQWEFRYLSTLGQANDLISPVLSPTEIYLADHSSWNNARPDALVPFISSTYRYGDNQAAWRAWDDEIIGVDTTGGIGGVVYRFAHHRSDVRSESNPVNPYFWYEPIANVSPDGRFVIFTSNWEKTLGRDAAEGTFRQDVFVVKLPLLQ